MLLSTKSYRNISSYVGIAVGRKMCIFYLITGALHWLNGCLFYFILFFKNWWDSLVTASWISALSDSGKSTELEKPQTDSCRPS